MLEPLHDTNRKFYTGKNPHARKIMGELLVPQILGDV